MIRDSNKKGEIRQPGAFEPREALSAVKKSTDSILSPMRQFLDSEHCSTPIDKKDKAHPIDPSLSLNFVKERLQEWLQGEFSQPGMKGLRTSMTPFLNPSLPQEEKKEILPSPKVEVHHTVKGIEEFTPKLVTVMTQDLHQQLPNLLSLNRSCRNAILLRLHTLAGTTPETSDDKSPDFLYELSQWIRGERSAAQEKALHMYLQEAALVYIAKVFLLKSWADRGHRKWSRRDLTVGVTSVLHSILKRDIPIGRKGWLLAQQNIYSWYRKPGEVVLDAIKNTVEIADLSHVSSSMISLALYKARTIRPEGPEHHGFDDRFLDALANWIETKFIASKSKKLSRPTLFSPTLRSGELIRQFPKTIEWIGGEEDHYLLSLAEVAYLWESPCAPFLWIHGTCLGAHSQNQLGFSLSRSPNRSITSLIAEKEACDLAVVFEERTIRIQSRSAEARRFREELAQLPFYEPYRSPGASKGDLQACLAASKLRPGGYLIWIRNEELGPQDGEPILKSLLKKNEFVCEWDFSELIHTLPTEQKLFPKYIYLFRKQIDTDLCAQNRPKRIVVQGRIRSHIEVPLFLSDVFQLKARQESPNDPWQIHQQVSSSIQGEWEDFWPERTGIADLECLKRIEQNSVALTEFGSIRPMQLWSKSSKAQGTNGFAFYIDQTQGKKSLVTLNLKNSQVNSTKKGYTFITEDSATIDPLRAYLESDAVMLWIEHHAEKKGTRLTIGEQLLRLIPVPKCLAETLTHPLSNEEMDSRLNPFHVPFLWNDLRTNFVGRINDVLAFQQNIENKALIHRPSIESEIFVLASQVRSELSEELDLYQRFFKTSHRIKWNELLKVLPPDELCRISMHPEIQIKASVKMSAYRPNISKKRVKGSEPGILLITENGEQTKIGSTQSRILDVLWEQIDQLNYPTWSEITDFCRLPRSIEMAERTANEILECRISIEENLGKLNQILSNCVKLQ